MKIKEKIKNLFNKINNLKFLLTILIIIILGGLFYWYEIRPSKIESFCNGSAIKSAQKRYYDVDWNTKYNKDDYEHYYKVCLRSRGLMK